MIGLIGRPARACSGFALLRSANRWYLRSNTAILYDPDGILAKSLPLADELEVAAHPKWFQPGDPTFVELTAYNCLQLG